MAATRGGQDATPGLRPGDGCYAPGVDVGETLLDRVGPCGFDVLDVFGWRLGLVEARDQLGDHRGPGCRGETQRRDQYIFDLARHLPSLPHVVAVDEAAIFTWVQTPVCTSIGG